MVYRANKRLRFVVPCILYLLVVGDSGSGKSKARTIVYKALALLLKQLEGRLERYSSALRARVIGLLKLVSGDATSTGILDMFDKNSFSPPKAAMMSDELCAQITRWCANRSRLRQHTRARRRSRARNTTRTRLPPSNRSSPAPVARSSPAPAFSQGLVWQAGLGCRARHHPSAVRRRLRLAHDG